MQYQKALGLSEHTNIIKNAINAWANENAGMAIVGDSVDEKLLTGFNNCIGPKCVVVFLGEDPYGSDDVRELTGRVIRNFEVLVTKGKYLGDPRNSALTSTTGNVRAFYEQVDELIDVTRNILYPEPFAVNPGIYNGVRPSKEEGWLLDGYIISFAVICERPRIMLEAPQLLADASQGPWAGLSQNIQFNKTPSVGPN